MTSVDVEETCCWQAPVGGACPAVAAAYFLASSATSGLFPVAHLSCQKLNKHTQHKINVTQNVSKPRIATV